MCEGKIERGVTQGAEQLSQQLGASRATARVICNNAAKQMRADADALERLGDVLNVLAPQDQDRMINILIRALHR